MTKKEFDYLPPKMLKQNELIPFFGNEMKATNMLLIILGIVIFSVSMTGGGFLFNLPVSSIELSVLWFVGVILVAIGLWLNEKEKKAK